MLFGKEYDKSLWLMMQSTNETQEMLRKFLDNLTDEMYQSIYQLKEKETSNPSKVKYSVLSGSDFNFLVEIDRNVLTVTLNKFYSNSRIQLGERYQLQLIILKDDFLGYRNVNNIHIGSFSYKKRELQGLNSKGVIMSTIKNDRYVLKRTSLGYIVNSFPIYSHNLNSSEIVNVQKIPEDVSLENLNLKKRKRFFCRKR